MESNGCVEECPRECVPPNHTNRRQLAVNLSPITIEMSMRIENWNVEWRVRRVVRPAFLCVEHVRLHHPSVIRRALFGVSICFFAAALFASAD